MFMSLYRFMDRLWQKTEIILTVTILVTMTLVTFAYTMLNNLYSLFFYLADLFASGSILNTIFERCGDWLMDGTYALSWSNALTKACFAWLIFFCMSYGVRVGGHIGVDALVKCFKQQTQRVLAYIGLGACLLYSAIFLIASLEWFYTFYSMGTEAEDLYQLGVLKWHIAIMVPLGFTLMIIRYLEIGYRIITHQQDTLGLADEAREVIEDVTLNVKGAE